MVRAEGEPSHGICDSCRDRIAAGEAKQTASGPVSLEWRRSRRVRIAWPARLTLGREAHPAMTKDISPDAALVVSRAADVAVVGKAVRLRGCCLDLRHEGVPGSRGLKRVRPFRR